MRKIRLNNKYLYYSAITLVILMFVFTFIDNPGGMIATITGKYPDAFPSLSNYMLENMHFDNFAIFGWKSFQLLLPILAIIPTINYTEEISNFLPHIFIRERRYKKEIMKSLIFNALFITLVLYIAYILSLLLGLLIFPINNEVNWFREVYADVLGPSFYMNNKVLYYILEGLIKMALPVFFYSLFSMCICLYTPKKSLSLLIPIMYHFCLLFAVPLICTILNDTKVLIYFAPQILIAPAGIIRPSTMKLIFGFSPYFIICMTLILIKILKKERVI